MGLVWVMGAASAASAASGPGADAAEIESDASETPESNYDEPILEETPDFARSGTYLGVAGVYAFESLDDGFGDANVRNSWGFNASVGQRLNRHWAVEAQWEWLDQFAVAGLFQPEDVFRVDGYVLSLNGRFYPIDGRLQPYLKAGVGFASIVAPYVTRSGRTAVREEDDFASRWGGGLDLYLTPSVALSASAEYVIGVAGLDFLEYVSLGWGLLYRF